jgi:hypothetical protein
MLSSLILQISVLLALYHEVKNEELEKHNKEAQSPNKIDKTSHIDVYT